MYSRLLSTDAQGVLSQRESLCAFDLRENLPLPPPPLIPLIPLHIHIYVYPGFKRSFSRPDLWSKIVRSVIKVLSLGRKFCPSLSLSLFRLLLRYRADNSFIFFNVSKNIASPRVYLLLTEQTFPFPFRRRLYLRQVLERNKQNRLRSFGPVNNVLLYFPPIFSYIYS